MIDCFNCLSTDKTEKFNRLLALQISFQEFLKNDLPKDIVSFDNVQTALSHNIYQQIELQEFLEANDSSIKEELIDYFLFMLNKYIYLGIKIVPYTIYELLWDSAIVHNRASCVHYANIEQDNFITFLRKYIIFKPWKRHEKENCCTNEGELYTTFYFSMEQFSRMAQSIFDSYEDFVSILNEKINININRQHNGY